MARDWLTPASVYWLLCCPCWIPAGSHVQFHEATWGGPNARRRDGFDRVSPLQPHSLWIRTFLGLYCVLMVRARTISCFVRVISFAGGGLLFGTLGCCYRRSSRGQAFRERGRGSSPCRLQGAIDSTLKLCLTLRNRVFRITIILPMRRGHFGVLWVNESPIDSCCALFVTLMGDDTCHVSFYSWIGMHVLWFVSLLWARICARDSSTELIPVRFP